MLLRPVMSIPKLALILMLVIGTGEAQGQAFDFADARAHSLVIEGPVRFHLGDDPDGKLRWAQAAFDDSQWPIVRSDRSLRRQGYEGYAGFAWYRFKVIVPAQFENLGILIPQLRTSYEVFADARFVGRFGGMPPEGKLVSGYDQIFPLPPSSSASEHSITIAIRVWNSDWLSRIGGGLEDPPVIGEIGALKSLKNQENRARFWSLASGNALMLMNLVAAFAGFFLFWMRPADREFLWFGLYELLTGVQHLCTDWSMFYPTNWGLSWLLDDCLATSSWLFFLIFIFRILNGRRNWLFWSAVGTEIATTAGTLLSLAGWIGWDRWRIASLLFLIPYFSCILNLLYRRARQGVADAQLMLLPVGFCYVTWFSTVLLGMLNAYGHAWVIRDFGWFFLVSRWPFPFTFLNIADTVMLLAVLAVLPLRFARSRGTRSGSPRRWSRRAQFSRCLSQLRFRRLPALPSNASTSRPVMSAATSSKSFRPLRAVS
jgi:hypothetical protein